MFNLFSNNTQHLDTLLDILLELIIAKVAPTYASGEIDNLDIIERHIAFGVQEDGAQAGTKTIFIFNKCDISSATGTDFDNSHTNHVHNFASAVTFDDGGVYVRRGVGKTWMLSNKNSDELVKACASLKKAIEAENDTSNEHILIFRNNIRMIASSHNAKLKDSVFRYATKYATDQIFNALSKMQVKTENKSVDKPVKPQTPTKPSKQTTTHQPAMTLDSVISSLKQQVFLKTPLCIVAKKSIILCNFV